VFEKVITLNGKTEMVQLSPRGSKSGSKRAANGPACWTFVRERMEFTTLLSRSTQNKVFLRFAQVGMTSALLSLSSACSLLDEAPSADSNVSIKVTIKTIDDVGVAVARAEVLLGKKSRGLTGPDGSLTVALAGRPGQVAPLTIKCPEGYASPEKTVDVGITELATGSPAPLFEARCTALAHSLVVAIRAENGPNLPILYLGKELGRTDAEGVAHVVLKMPPGETASLRLDTSAAPALKPQNPELTFKSSNRDEMVLLEQKFSIVRKVVAVHAPARPQPL